MKTPAYLKLRKTPHLKLRKTRNPDGKCAHQCCMCGHYGVWGASWSWYGNYEDRFERDVGQVDKMCSAKCKEDYCKKNKVEKF